MNDCCKTQFEIYLTENKPNLKPVLSKITLLNDLQIETISKKLVNGKSLLGTLSKDDMITMTLKLAENQIPFSVNERTIVK